MTIKAAKAKAAEAKAKAAEAKDEPTAKKSAAVKQVGTKQKIKKQAATDIKQKTAAKEDAKRCTVSFPGALVVLVSAALFFAVTMALRSNSSVSTGAAAEVLTTKPVSSWASGLYDNNVRNDFCAVQEAFETCSVRLDDLSAT